MPGMSGVVYDKALRGAMVDEVWNLGLHPIVPVYDKTAKSTETYPIGTHTLTLRGEKMRAGGTARTPP